jgi:hypothetical protein
MPVACCFPVTCSQDQSLDFVFYCHSKLSVDQSNAQGPCVEILCEILCGRLKDCQLNDSLGGSKTASLMSSIQERDTNEMWDTATAAMSESRKSKVAAAQPDPALFDLELLLQAFFFESLSLLPKWQPKDEKQPMALQRLTLASEQDKGNDANSEYSLANAEPPSSCSTPGVEQFFGMLANAEPPSPFSLCIIKKPSAVGPGLAKDVFHHMCKDKNITDFNTLENLLETLKEVHLEAFAWRPTTGKEQEAMKVSHYISKYESITDFNTLETLLEAIMEGHSESFVLEAQYRQGARGLDAVHRW